MAEKTAGEILLAQLELDVQEVKAALLRDSCDVDAMEQLVARVVMRWWIGRMVKAPSIQIPAEEQKTRGMARAQAYAATLQIIKARSGPISTDALQMSVLGLTAQVDALWTLLMEAALVTACARQDYMDGSTNDLFERAKAVAQQVLMPGAHGSRRPV